MLERFGEWIASNLVENLFSYILDHLGISSMIATAIAMPLAVLALGLLKKNLDTSFDPRLEKIDLNDEDSLRCAFDDVSIVISLSSYLEESPADNFEDFLYQVKQLRNKEDISRTVWEKLDPDDNKMMANLFLQKDTVNRIGDYLDITPAETIDELRKQVRKLKKLKA